jgi:hypothetical protein
MQLRSRRGVVELVIRPESRLEERRIDCEQDSRQLAKSIRRVAHPDPFLPLACGGAPSRPPTSSPVQRIIHHGEPSVQPESVMPQIAVLALSLSLSRR